MDRTESREGSCPEVRLTSTPTPISLLPPKYPSSHRIAPSAARAFLYKSEDTPLSSSGLQANCHQKVKHLPPSLAQFSELWLEPYKGAVHTSEISGDLWPSKGAANTLPIPWGDGARSLPLTELAPPQALTKRTQTQ